MSGYNGRLIYDPCAIKQQYKFSTEEANYQMFSHAYVHPNFNKQGDEFCKKQSAVSKCQTNLFCGECSSDGVIGTGPQFIPNRVEIESELRGIPKNFSPYGNRQHFLPTHMKEKQENVSVMVPILCERNIFPSNLKEF